MKTSIRMFVLAAVSLVSAACMTLAPPRLAGAATTLSAASLVGSWALVRVDNLMPDGSRIHLYGADPQGMLVFDAQGRYALQILRGDRAKFASNDKAEATPEEFRAATLGSNTHFGRYAVDETHHTVTFHIDHASFPNWEGTEQVRQLQIDHAHLTYIVPTPTSGAGAVGEVEWKRLAQ
jgi:Lipocalin-like domain